MQKKAAVEVQFNWIFILVAGALILFLFSSIILKQKTTADSAAQTTLLKDITSIAVGSEATTGVTTELELSKATITFGCNTIRVGSKSQPLQQMVLFSPSTVQTPLIIHTRDWSLPFRVTNVVYLSSPKVRYVLIGNSEFAKQINKSMPEKFTVDFYQDYAAFSAKPIQKDDSIRIVVFEDAGLSFDSLTTIHPQLTSLPPKVVSLLAVGNGGNQNQGDVRFYSKTQNGWSAPSTMNYLKEEMLIGAIFTDSHEQYQCVTNNMLAKLVRVADIHDKRRQALYEETSSPTHPLNTRCNSFYFTPASTNLATLMDQSSTYTVLYGTAYSAPSGLSFINKDLERNSCPLLY
jgi:hypothetical protein